MCAAMCKAGFLLGISFEHRDGCNKPIVTHYRKQPVY